MTNRVGRIDITPESRVGDLLEAYPEIEEALIAMSPAFARLRNPILRKTVAKVATLRQVAAVGGVPLARLVNELRRVTGQEDAPGEASGEQEAEQPPDWLDSTSIAEVFDVRPLLEAGQHPAGAVMQRLGKLRPGERLELVTAFQPAPLIDLAKKQGYRAWSKRESEDLHRTWFAKA